MYPAAARALLISMKRTPAVIAALLLATSCGSSESDAHKAAREQAKTEAGYYCTMVPAGNDPGYIHTSEFKSCVKDQTARFLGEWEADHPDD